MAVPNAPVLSHRGVNQLQRSVGPVRMHNNFRNGYHPITSPKGLVNMAIAENTLMSDELDSYFRKAFHLNTEDFTYGDGLTGTSRLSTSLANFLNARFEPKNPVLRDHIILGNGLVTVLSHLARVLADAGDAFLIAAPYYQGFDVSLTVENGVLVVGVPVSSEHMFTLDELEYLERGLDASNASGTQVRAVILCNPHNPLGRCYPREVVEAYCRFCEKHNLHLISDEVYAFSTFPTSFETERATSPTPRDSAQTIHATDEPPTFFSALSVDLDRLGVNASRVHVMYGMSKDFACNGFRIGALISQANPDVLSAMTLTAVFMLVASPADKLWSALLDDSAYLATFFATNRARLLRAYTHITRWLDFHGLPYAGVHAGHVLMVDWRGVLADTGRYGALLAVGAESSMLERERALAGFLHAHGVVVAPGTVLHMPEPGWTRVTFTISPEYVDVALRRIEVAFGWPKWEGERAVEMVEGTATITSTQNCSSSKL